MKLANGGNRHQTWRINAVMHNLCEHEVSLSEGTLREWADSWATSSKQETSNRIAITLVWFFGFAILALLVVYPILINNRPIGEAEQVTHIFGQYLQAVGNFVSTVFSQLLAFILGYYFAARKRR
jgi:hypothetical protein